MGIANANFRYYTADDSPLVMTFNEAGYTSAASVSVPRTPPTTQRTMRVELRNMRSGKDDTLGLKDFR